MTTDKSKKTTTPPDDQFTSIDLQTADVSTIYSFLIGGIVPRPIAFVSTMSPEGKGNVAPFSFYNGVSSTPPCLMISVSRKPNGEKKDTLRNIEANQEFVVNSVNEWMTEAAHNASANYPYGVDELEQVGLTALSSDLIAPKRVKESGLQFECKLHKTLEIGDDSAGSVTLIIGKILKAHIMSNVYQDGKILIDRFKPVSRLGGPLYGLTNDTFPLDRPKLKEDHS